MNEKLFIGIDVDDYEQLCNLIGENYDGEVANN